MESKTMEPKSKAYWITKQLFTTGVEIKECRKSKFY